MKLEIKRGAVVNITVSIDERTVMSHRLLGEDVVNATFESKSALDIAIKDYIEHDGKTYTINNLPQVKKLSSLKYEYTAVFESLQYQLLKTQYLSSGLSEFDLVGDADDFMDLIITNMNRVDSGWTKGTVKSTDAIHLSFREESCLAVIQRLAAEFECEFELSTKEIKLTDIGEDTGLSFSYGKNKGLYDLTRQTVSSKNIVTRLYAYGSERNIDKDYRTYSKRLMFAAAGSNYVENNVATYGLIEAVKIFEEVYPHREGTISYVDAGDVKIFRDSGIDFDVNSYLIEGVSAKIHFNTGNLAGFEFELTSYEHTDKEFTLLKNSNIQDYELPNSTLKPAIGDKYVILDITMPAAYITTAEADLTTKATDFINENSDPRVNYLLTPDPKYFKDNAINLKVGDKVTIVDSELSIDKLVRIIRLTQSLYNTYEYTLEFSDHLETQTILRIIAEQKEAGRKIIISDVGDIQKARRNWRSTAELQNVIFDPDDYFDTGNIRPLSIETSMLTVGNKSQQFFLKDVIMQPNYTGDAAKFEVSTGSLVHFTIDATIKIWTLSSNSYNSLVAGTVYYIYARCNRADTAGQIILDTTQRKIDYGSTYYYFLVGVLHSVSDSVRCISLTYGFTRINGKFITTGEIKSQDGLTKFNLDTGVITGKITFIAGTDGYANITDKPDVIKTFIQSAAPTPVNVGDLWHDTDDDVLYRWSGSIWEATTDDTTTTINGGLITSGRIELGSGGTIRAGINGYGTLGGEIRIWAGDTYANRAKAPFRVNQDGEVFGTKGIFGGWHIAKEALYTPDSSQFIHSTDSKGHLYPFPTDAWTPMVYYYNKKTYQSWTQRDTAGYDSRAMIWAYNHETDTASANYDLHTISQPTGDTDPHVVPSVIVADDGHIIVVHEYKRVAPASHNDALVILRSDNVEDETSWVNAKAENANYYTTVGDSAIIRLGYQNLIKDLNGYLYIIARRYTSGGLHTRIFKSMDHGITWDAGYDITYSGSAHWHYPAGVRVGTDNVLRYMIRFYNVSTSRYTNVYYLESHDQGVTWQDVSGSHSQNIVTGGVISQATLDNGAYDYLVTNPAGVGNDEVRPCSGTINEEGIPFICTKENDVPAVDWGFRMFWWNGSSWANSLIIDNVAVGGEGCLIHKRGDEFDCYLAEKPAADINLDLYSTTNLTTWSKTRDVKDTSGLTAFTLARVKYTFNYKDADYWMLVGAYGTDAAYSDIFVEVSGSYKLSDGFSTTGITFAANGSIHAPNFYVNSDGTCGFKQIVEAKFKVEAGQGIKIEGNHLYESEDSTDGGFITFNYHGYAGGVTKFRTTNFYNGKHQLVMQVGGSDATIKTYGLLNIKNGISSDINVITGTDTLVFSDYITICNNTVAITVYLPASPKEGEVHIVKRGNSGTVTLHGNGKNIYLAANVASVGLDAGKSYTVVYDVGYGKWAAIGKWDA